MTREPYCASLRLSLIAILVLLVSRSIAAQTVPHTFKVVVIAEAGGIHKPFVDAAKVWLQKESQTYNFTVDYIEDTKLIKILFSHSTGFLSS